MTPERLDLNSMDITEQKKEMLKEAFPEIFTEGGKIDFEKLKSILGESLDTGGREKYGMSWAGKSKLIQIIQEQSKGTLRPAQDESVDWDTTEHVFIEGDNLEVLKLLQKSYLGKIKMIYIDPPYNTGKDFVYPDNYTENLETYLEYTGQKSAEGKRFGANLETDGRFHSKWLNMMYPRLFLARNLLRDDGVIFISIGDEELDNLKKLCQEIFGEENFEGHIHWRRRHNQPNDPTKMIAIVAEHIIAFSKNKKYLKQAGVGKIGLTGKFTNPDNDPRGDWASKPWKVGSDQSGSKYTIITPTNKEYNEEWMGDEATYKKLLEDNRIIFPNNGNGPPRKKYFKFEREEEGQCATNWWQHDKFGHNQMASDELNNLMGMKNVFSNPKPVELITNLCAIANCHDGDIILDFFAGSNTTYHAILQSSIGAKSISIQLPEPLDPNDSDQKVGYEFCKTLNKVPTIAEIAKERMRRVIEQKNGDNLDLGFRVYKLDTSNFKPWSGEIDNAADLAPELDGFIDPFIHGRKQEDILFEILLKSGYELSAKIEEIQIAGKRVFSVSGGALLICLEDEVNDNLFKQVAEKDPIHFICLDKAFHNQDDLKANAVLTFKARQNADGTPKTIFKTV